MIGCQSFQGSLQQSLIWFSVTSRYVYKFENNNISFLKWNIFSSHCKQDLRLGQRHVQKGECIFQLLWFHRTDG